MEDDEDITAESSMSLKDGWQKVFGSNGVLLIENFPAGLEFGCNCMVYETGSRFKGVAMLPAGLHFVYYSHINFPRQGFFTFLQPQLEPLKYRSWHNDVDELLPVTSPEILVEKMHHILRGDYNANLAPYAEEQHSTWQNISSFISDSVLQRAQCPLEKLLQAGDDADETEADRMLTAKLQSHPTRPSQLLSNLSNISNVHTTTAYCPIQSIEADIVQATYQQSDFPKRLSAMELDKSWLIEAMLKRYYNNSNNNNNCTNNDKNETMAHWSSILGELQIAFIMFMLLYSYHSLNHWKLLIGYISKAERFLQQNQDFSAAFLKVLFHQLKFIPEDFFEHEISANSFILPSLTSLFSCLNFPTMNEDLQEHKKRFERYIAKRFNIRVVSTTISQYASTITAESAAATAAQETEASRVDDAYCVIEGNDMHENEELLAEIAGNEALLASTSRNHADDGENDDAMTDKTPVKLSIPMEQVLSPQEKEEIRFSWRYPLVFTAMQASQGREDMIMTAMRLYDEISYQQYTQASSVTSEMEEILKEAIKFIENEGPLL